ncbi:demethylmenaquinone methyltransferase [Bacillus sp. A301a_S52]|jgi:demethylmenaquinone methyltransferase/2-methoxy-6-polyprenyl-1,4-benzoquinol methylase|nr:demethylmenaquinone methyltransferase [Bacillus sp. A301a_S52]
MERTKEERVHDVFESISKEYDRMNGIISFKQHNMWRKDTMKKMDVEKGARALDICCGTADWAITLAEAVGEEGHVTGVDFSENMLKVGGEKIKKMNVPNITLQWGNAMELPFDDNQFDCVTIGFGLRNVPDYLQVLREMHRVVKPGGLAVCLETSQPTMPIFKQAYWFYFTYVMPLFGKIFAKSYAEYSWLQESSRHFPGKKELKQLFYDAGFASVKYKSYSGGAVASHFATK